MTQVTEDSIAETSTSTGTGDMVLAGAIAGHRTFSSKAADTNLVPYRIEAVDSNGNATGDWETGIGTYNSAANSITRTKVDASSNANALVNFSAGTKRISLVLLSSQMYQISGIPFQQLESLSAGFDPQYFWGFIANTEGWTSSNSSGGTVTYDTANGKGLLIEDISTSIVFNLRSPSGLSINGNIFRRVKLSITIIDTITGAPASAFAPVMQYVTGGHSFSASYQRVIKYPFHARNNDTFLYDFDMEIATGAPDWQTNIITQIQFNLTSTVTSGYKVRVNWIAVGENRPSQGSDKRMRIMAVR